MTDDELFEAFASLTLTSSQFTHLAHLRVGWILLQRHDLEEAAERACQGIRALATHLGAAEKFHWTLTVAMIHVLRAHGAADRSRGWEDFLAANPALLASARERVAEYYSEARLGSEAARSGFVAPDRAPLPMG